MTKMKYSAPSLNLGYSDEALMTQKMVAAVRDLVILSCSILSLCCNECTNVYSQHQTIQLKP